MSEQSSILGPENLPNRNKITIYTLFVGTALQGWKEIANFLGVTERTARRWEQSEGLPIRRQQHEAKASVFAYPEELEQWREKRSLAPAAENQVAAAPPGASPLWKRYRWQIGAAAAILAITLFAGWRASLLPKAPLAWDRVKDLTNDPGIEIHPAISPDGKSFAYSKTEGPNQHLNVREIGSPVSRRVTAGDWMELSPVWRPDGQAIYYWQQRPGVQELAEITLATGVQRTVASLEAEASVSHGWVSPRLSMSPDGEYLFTGDSQAPSTRRRITAIRIRDGEKRVLTPPELKDHEEFPAVSPDGSHIAFVLNIGWTFRPLCLLSNWRDVVEGRAEHGVLNCDRRIKPEVNGLAWTRDNRLIASAGGIGFPRLVEYDLKSGTEQRILLPERAVFTPQIDSQGRLAFTRITYEMNIRTVDLQSGWNRSNPADWELVAPSTGHEMTPIWSQDQRKIYLVSDQSGAMEIYEWDRQQKTSRALTQEGWKRGGVVCLDGKRGRIIVNGQKPVEKNASYYELDPISTVLKLIPGLERMEACILNPEGKVFASAVRGKQPGLWQWEPEADRWTLLEKGVSNRFAPAQDGFVVSFQADKLWQVRKYTWQGQQQQVLLDKLDTYPASLDAKSAWFWSTNPAGIDLKRIFFDGSPAEEASLPGSIGSLMQAAPDGARLALSFSMGIQADLRLAYPQAQ